MRALWLLPVLGVGLFLLASRSARKPASEAEKRQAYSFAQEYARRQLGQDYFGRDLRKSPITLRFPPFDSSAVVPLGRGRFRCTSYVEFERRARPPVRDDWSGVVAEEGGRWHCEQFQARTFGLPP